MQNPFDPPLEIAEDLKKESRSKGKNSAVEQGSNIPLGWKPTLEKPLPVVRCTGTVRNGENKGGQCPNWSIRGHNVCASHGGQLPAVKQKAEFNIEQARKQMLGIAPTAIEVIEQIMISGGQEAVRLKAAEIILDRAGITKGPVEHKVEVNHSLSQAEEIRKKLSRMGERFELIDLGEESEEEDEDIIDAEEETA